MIVESSEDCEVSPTRDDCVAHWTGEPCPSFLFSKSWGCESSDSLYPLGYIFTLLSFTLLCRISAPQTGFVLHKFSFSWVCASQTRFVLHKLLFDEFLISLILSLFSDTWVSLFLSHFEYIFSHSRTNNPTRIKSPIIASSNSIDMPISHARSIFDIDVYSISKKSDQEIYSRSMQYTAYHSRSYFDRIYFIFGSFFMSLS